MELIERRIGVNLSLGPFSSTKADQKKLDDISLARQHGFYSSSEVVFNTPFTTVVDLTPLPRIRMLWLSLDEILALI